MSVFNAMRSAAIRLSHDTRGLTQFFGSESTFAIEICDLVNEVARDIVAYQDWSRLTKVYTLNGDGATDVFPFPADYDRQLQNTNLQDLETWAWGYTHVTDLNDFLYIKERGFFQLSPGAWIIYGGEIHFTPAPTGTATFPYISKNYAFDPALVATKPEFTDDSDEFLLEERLLTLGLIWRWREMKKLDYSGDQEAFMKALDEAGTGEAGSRVIRWGSGVVRNRIGWPFLRA